MARPSKKLAPVAANPPEDSEETLPALEPPPFDPDTTGVEVRRISQPPRRASKDTPARLPRPHNDLEGERPAPSKRKPAARKSKGRAEGSAPVVSRRRELVGLALTALGLLCTMALWSYRPNDGPWAVPKHDTHNWVGPVGAMIADGLIGAFGLGSHVLALGLLLVGGLCFMRRPPTPSRVQIAGAALTLLSAAIISHLALRGTNAVPYAPGGLLGAVCGDGLARLFSAPGTAVIAGAAFAAGVVLCTDLSLSRMLRALGSMLSVFTDAWHEYRLVQAHKAELRRKMEEEAQQRLLEQAREDEEREHQARAEKAERRKLSARLKAEAELENEQRQAEEFARHAAVERALPEKPRALPPPLPASALPQPVEPAAPIIHVAAPVEEPAVAPRRSEPPVEPAVVIAPPTEAKRQAPVEEPIVVAPEPAAAEPVVAPLAAPVPAAPQLEPRIVDAIPKSKAIEEKLANAKDERPRPFGQEFQLPPLNLLDYEAQDDVEIDREALNENARILTRTFKDFGIEGHVREIRPGPVVTTYEFTPAAGIRVGKISGMADDLAMALEAMSVRIVAPIPGKNAVGIEIPNQRRQNVYLKEIIAGSDFQRARSKLTLALGKDIEGKAFTADLAKMPHVLIAGTTGSGKSVSVNGMILSLLYKATPDEVRLLMIDPKMLELKLYEGIPHLLLPPVTDPKKAALALRWAVEEMERRYQLLADFSVRDISTFNKKMETLKADASKQAAEAAPENAEGAVEVITEEEGSAESDARAIKKHNGVPDKLPFIVVIVDEFADLMMVASKDVETYVARLAQKARACGIHVMLATQRPSVDVITGVIKANFPTRMSFKVASAHDSKTIINSVGANRLLGNGDMLMIPPGTSDLTRVHGGYVSETEITRVVNFWKSQGKPQYNEAILKAPEEEGEGPRSSGEPADEFYEQAIDVVARSRRVSISEIQRKLGVGYNRAAKMVERMEADGLIGPSQGANKPREVYVRNPAETE